ncbi:MAG: DAK2 domain-containing protein [Lachnospiraceae bacterium]|nr:DAK2 domain-containing protein [Lachnospiraceae bacterium]MDY6221228.1 DAK2 domain-containing protein [Candidatus Alectryocaccobium sp.]
MSEKYIDAEMLERMFISGAYNLEANKEWINELNVFPVPDGDTGTNMTLTILSAVSEVKALGNATMPELSKAISHGSLRGARGNSGVILSQLLRGFSKTIQDHERIDQKLLAAAMERAVETAYKAVMRPKEGTILTVAKGVARKAVHIAKDNITLDEFMTRIIEEGEKVLAATPDMLPVLKEAGVVDSGGQGLIVVLKGAYAAYAGKPVEAPKTAQDAAVKPVAKTDVKRPEGDIKFGYCTEFIVNLANSVSDKEVDRFKDFLESMGDSIVCVPDDDFIKIHVHTNDPGKVLQKGLSYGELSRIKIDNMREEHREMLELEKSGQAENTDKAGEAVKEQPAEAKKYGFITVAAGEGFDQLFNDMEVDIVINGGQTMNPSTEDFINAINKINAECIFIYPNNKNIIMAANQARDLTEDKTVIVIPTKTVTQGITAMINFASEYSPEENADIMNECIKAVQTSQITYSIRDTHVDDFDIKSGDIMAVGDRSILAVGSDINEVALSSVRTIMSDEAELISIYYGEGYTKEQAEELGNAIEEEYPDCSVEVQFGGQPVYYCIISVE